METVEPVACGTLWIPQGAFAMSLARFWDQEGRSDSAPQILSSVYGQFTEGFARAVSRAGIWHAAVWRPRLRA
jgi:hypothetical protein